MLCCVLRFKNFDDTSMNNHVFNQNLMRYIFKLKFDEFFQFAHSAVPNTLFIQISSMGITKILSILLGFYWCFYLRFLSCSHGLKITQNVTFEFFNFGISTNFWPIKTDLSGNTVWPKASRFQKLAKMDHFWHFSLTFVQSKSVNVAVEWEFFCHFQTLCSSIIMKISQEIAPPKCSYYRY